MSGPRISDKIDHGKYILIFKKRTNEKFGEIDPKKSSYRILDYKRITGKTGGELNSQPIISILTLYK